MRKKSIAILLGAAVMLTVAGCSSNKDEVKVINKLPQKTAGETTGEAATSAAVEDASVQSSTVEAVASQEEAPAEEASVEETSSEEVSAQEETAEETVVVEKKSSAAEVSEFVFVAGGVSVRTDMDMSSVLDSLGEPGSYFEAASCAFEGLDKIYTYDHFQITTYPDGDRDVISTILLLDDAASTKEGIHIGMTQEDMESVYGTGYQEKKGMLVYTKGGRELAFLVKGGIIQSIEYDSSVLDM